MHKLIELLSSGDALEAQFEIEAGEVKDFFLLKSVREWTPLELEATAKKWLIDRLKPDLMSFASECDSAYEGCGPVPDGAYIFHVDGCELFFELTSATVIEHEFVIDKSPSPTIPMILRIFGFSLSRFAYEQLFEPAYLDLQNDYARSREIANQTRWARRLVELAFAVRAARIATECLVLDWLNIGWRRCVWIVFSLVAGRSVARWIFGL